MKTVFLSLLVTLTLFSQVASADPIKTKNQAIAACKSHVKTNFEDFKRSKLKKIRVKKDHYAVRIAVNYSGQKETVNCNISKDQGIVTIS